MVLMSGVYYFDGREAVLRPEPVVSADGRFLLVADARIDNQSELFGEIGDAETILRAYEKWGEGCAERLIGDFAFAVWDRKERAFFSARDGFGVRPFYYHLSSDKLIFSSEITGVLQTPGVPRRLDETTIASHLLWDTDDQEATFYRDVKKLPAAHFLKTLPNGGAAIRRYWSLDPGRELKGKSDAACAEGFRAHFTEAVRCRLLAPPHGGARVGCLLSGGLDSSAVTAVARDLSVPLHTFSAVFDEVPSSDERPFIEAITSMEGIQPHFIQAGRIAPFHGIREALRHAGEPSTYELSIFRQGIYPAAKEAGVGVLLDGDGGDEVVSRGYLRLAELLIGFRWAEYGRTLSALSKNLGRSMADLFISQSLRPLVPPAALRAWRRARWGNRSLWIDRTLFNPAFARRARLAEREEARIRTETTPARSVKEQHLRELTSGAVSYAFPIIRQAAGRFGIEHRYPFHDRRLAEYCLSLPSDQKLYRGWTKIVMRRALEGLLPDAVRWRGGKTYLADEFVYRFERFERGHLERVIVGDPSRIAPYFNVERLRKLYRSFIVKPSYEFAIILWQAVLLDLWLECMD